jgi:hypothetical protein
MTTCGEGTPGELRIQWGNPWESKSPLAHHKFDAHRGDGRYDLIFARH